MGRRTFLVAGAAVVSAASSTATQTASPTRTGAAMYGVMGKMNASPGSREALIAILLEGTGAMPGCLTFRYVYQGAGGTELSAAGSPRSEPGR